MMKKIDFKKEFKQLYSPPKGKISIVDVPVMNFLMVDGVGYPVGNPAYEQALVALYGISYGLKFVSKAQGKDYVVTPLEGLWWMEDVSGFSMERKDEWEWTMMIMQPEWVTRNMVDAVLAEMAQKKDLIVLEDLRFEAYHEGLSAQTFYVGPYSEEGPTIANMHAHIEAEGYLLRGKHHEIYLNDARKTAPEKLKTVIRQPIKKA
ncbi:MAG: GyrI-like domain-containing protein [Anaerolineales bacterium]|nr:GyrI-like domain-containing protein [Anaerolineales bacterium]